MVETFVVDLCIMLPVEPAALHLEKRALDTGQYLRPVLAFCLPSENCVEVRPAAFGDDANCYGMTERFKASDQRRERKVVPAAIRIV